MLVLEEEEVYSMPEAWGIKQGIMDCYKEPSGSAVDPIIATYFPISMLDLDDKY